MSELKEYILTVLITREKYLSISFILYLHEVICLVAHSCSTLCDPMVCSPPGSSVHGDSPGKNTGVGCHAFLQRWLFTKSTVAIVS